VRFGQVEWPTDVVLACIVRGGRPIAPSPDDTLEARDELLFVTSRDADEGALEHLLKTSTTTPGVSG
jgi:trk system potassium uptake protein